MILSLISTGLTMIIQTNLYICDVCAKIESETNEVSLFSDPLVSNGWDYIKCNDFSALACLDCLGKYKNKGFPGVKDLLELRKNIL